MKLQVLQEDFARSLSIASRFTISKAQLPVLGNVLLSVQKNKLLVVSTNLEISISISIGAKVVEEGELTIPARTLLDIVSNLGKGQINLETEKDLLKITSNDFSSTISGMNTSDFPSVPKSLEGEILEFESNKFSTCLNKTIFTSSLDETRPILTGVLFSFLGSNNTSILNLVATDGYRLSWNKLDLSKKTEDRKLIIPRNVLNEIVKLTGSTEKITFVYKESDNQVIFGLKDMVVSSRVLDGEFPDFEKIIPKESNLKVSLDAIDFKRGVKLASIFARDAANVVKLKIAKQNLTIYAESQTSGNQETTIDIKSEGEPTEVAFNYRFLEEFIETVEASDIEMELKGPSSPGIFKDPNNPEFLHLIMPVKLQS